LANASSKGKGVPKTTVEATLHLLSCESEVAQNIKEKLANVQEHRI
jgi:hypothetical protein